ncbi:MAG: response regulator transcription factor [Firmicutes bacterium]|nr:response regulator transcription factor [Bacillota bacterium]
MIRILIVEDEPPISGLIRMNLNRNGYECDVAFDGEQAADKIEQNRYDLILLDIMLPKINGYELIDYIRPLEIPVIFITAKNDLQDRVKGLKLGAEDYIVKPFEIIELLARVEVVLRRYKKTNTVINIEDVSIDTEARRVTKNGVPVDLTIKEYDLLLLLVRNPGIALFRETLFERVWGYDYIGETRTLDSHVQRLRRKLGWEDKIKTVYKIGYRLDLKNGNGQKS